MKPRPTLRLFLTFALFALGFVAAFPSTSKAAEQLYTCGMHPQIIKKEPGDCPICGMKLTPIRANTSGQKDTAKADSGEHKIKYYKSSMTPGEVSPNPGKDSMGMDLVPVYDDAGNGAEAIQIDPVTIQVSDLRISGGLRIAHVTPEFAAGTACGAEFSPSTSADARALGRLLARLEKLGHRSG